ncbi:relaxase MobL [Mycoplasma sp. CSL7491-lung]|uniref:relaxase MobL n=1 Tax=Mycoplasma sp. CSL7491-lung TaxID=549718 RepID=UPI001C0F4261|nr:relaxase MobL [Mycoplasma sp. CSL7491-lung]MBU4692753.1 relaxase MobL [Mycoplasma sp. CSL7491-lung]
MDHFIQFNFISKKSGYITKLGNKHDYKSWVGDGEFIRYYTKAQKAVEMSEFNLFENINNLNNKEDVLKVYKSYLKKNINTSKSGLCGFIGGVYKENIDINKLSKEMQTKNNVFYEMVISTNDAMLNNIFVGNEKWKNLVENQLFKWLESDGLNFDRNNLEVYYAIHGNTDNPHIHLAFTEIENKRNLERKNFGISKNIFERKFSELKTSILNEYGRTKNDKNIYDELNEIRNLKLKFKKEFLDIESLEKDKIQILKKEYNESKNIWYSRLSTESKKVVLELRDKLLEQNKEFKKVYTEFYKTYEQYMNLDIKDKALKTVFIYKLKKEEKEFERKILNEILKQVVFFKEDKKYSNNSLSEKYKTSLDAFYRYENKKIKNIASKDTKKIKRLAYALFEAQNVKEYEKVKSIDY